MRLLTGLRAWVAQRASAVFMLGFLVWLAGLLLLSPPDGYEQWRVLVARPAVSVAFAGFFVALLIHAWVGARDVVLDYVHNPGARATALVLVGAVLAATGAWLGLTLAALHVR